MTGGGPWAIIAAVIPSRRILAALAAVAACGAAFSVAPARRGGRSRTPAWVASIAPETLRTRPNILLVVYDARRQDDFSFGPHGNARRDTPFLSAFKDDALYFPRAVSPGCWTVPVHASMFTGLSVCELGNDIYSRGFQSFQPDTRSLAELLHAAGYRTFAFPDHPYFYAGSIRASLVRGFERFSVINGHGRLGTLSNVGAKGTQPRRSYPFDAISPAKDVKPAEIAAEIERFNRGEIRFDLSRDADYDPERGLYLAPVGDLFRASPYFRLRYGDAFDTLFATRPRAPYFLFLNIHMCTLFCGDHPLYSRWLLRTLMMNAQHLGETLRPPRGDEGVQETLKRNVAALRIHRDVMSEYGPLKQIFDNRFYDAAFESVWSYLESHGLADNLLTVVASDHGMSFGEHGESRYLHAGALPNEYITRVPLIVRFPKGSELRRLHGVNERTVSLTDVFPTLLEAGVGPGVYQSPTPVRGLSLVSRVVHGSYDRVVVSECALRPDSYRKLPGRAAYVKAFYEDPLKLIYAPETFVLDRTVSFQDPLPEARRFLTGEKIERLHDLSRDPDEAVDIAADNREAVARLKSGRPEPWSCFSTTADAAPAWDDDALDTLRSLGYIN